jgi:type IV pilus assembly protein PilC
VTSTFTYKVRDRQGNLVKGSLEANNQTLVVDKLRQMGYVPIAVEQQSGSALQKELKIPGFGGRVKLKDTAVFSRQFATMINSGLTIMRSLSILSEQTDNKAFCAVIDEVRNDVETGTSLSQALGRHPKAFSRLYVAMVRAGETGGVLDATLEQLATTIENQVRLRGKIRSAMTYPIAVFGLVLFIVSAMLIFVVPMFEALYNDLGGKLPLPTRILLGMSNFATTMAPVLIIAAGGGFWAFRRWLRTDMGRSSKDVVMLRVPVFGKLIRKTALTRFSRNLAVLLRSGVPILESLEITADTVNNTVMSKAIFEVQAAVRMGESVAKPLGEHPIFPPMIVQMMAVGEETGALDVMLDKVGEFYDREVEATVDALTSLLEPALIVFMGGSVGAMVIALYLPMFNVINLVK